MGFPQPDIGSVTEDTDLVGGLLTTSGDADFGPFFNNDAGQWTAETLTGGYDSQLVIDSDGNWSYEADNSNPAIQALNTGDTITEVFTISSTAGSTTITITINGQDEPPCFAAGTLIDTPHGPRPVEVLAIGDTVLTRDSGVQEIRWIGTSEIDTRHPEFRDSLQPIRVTRDAIAPGVPDRDLLLSPMHRILIADPDVQLMIGLEEGLCAVKHLVNGTTIRREPVETVRYCHMLFDFHQIVQSSGCASESFYPGHVGLNGFQDETREELFDIFPDLRGLPETYGQTARPVLRRHEAEMLRDRLSRPAGFLRDIKAA